jgi:N-acetylglucosamine-6-sulfatase
MRKTSLLLSSIALAVLFSCGSDSSHPAAKQRSTPQQQGPTQQSNTMPNIVLILADDMRYDDLKYMPKTRSLLADRGMSFHDAFVSNAVCCPSRATIMRGQYSHNNGVWSNSRSDSPSTTSGGWHAYKQSGDEQDNVATRLHDAGYATGLFGKYLNGYHGSAVPAGWTDWFGVVSGHDEFYDVEPQYFDYDVNDNGTMRHFGDSSRDYSTDVLSRQAKRFIGQSATQGKPFFAYVAPIAPHTPDTPAPRDLHAYHGEKAPRPPSFNEADVSDKPPWMRSHPLLDSHKVKKIDLMQRKRAETLQALDDLVGGVVNKLDHAGVMDNTYVFFTSDNGWHQGEHRVSHGKRRPYEEDVHMPLLVRGPGIAAGSTTNKLALNTDYLPTFSDLAGTQTPSYVDGRSLRPVLEGSATTWRSAVLLEAAANHRRPPYAGIRTSNGRKYVEYKGGARELYELGADPYELTNKYVAALPPNALVERLRALQTCAADTCSKAENEQ